MGSCERGILSYNTTRKGGGVHTEIMLPLHAPPSFSDHSALWNSVELYEKGELNRNIQKANRMIKEVRAQIGNLKEWIDGLLTERDAAPEKPPNPPTLQIF